MINPYHTAVKRRLFTEVHTAPAADYGTSVLSCIFIVAGALCLFWIYGALFQHPSRGAGFSQSIARVGHQLTSTAAPAPDMTSAAILFANADVPPPPKPKGEEASLSKNAQAPLGGKRRTVERQRAIKRTQVAKRAVPAARNAHAAYFNFFSSSSFGSF